MLSEFLLFFFALINERKNISARKRLLTPKDQIDVLISFPDKPFSDKLNVFLYKQYFAKTQFYKNMINFTAISKNILFKQQGKRESSLRRKRLVWIQHYARLSTLSDTKVQILDGKDPPKIFMLTI